MALLDDVRVLDVSGGITGPYASKLLADAGAEVIKVEAPRGDPLRRWSASGYPLDGCDGALFRYLNASKRSVVGDLDDEAVRPLLDGADLLLEDGVLDLTTLERLRLEHHQLVIVSVTPFGRTGPFASTPATEFTLQGWCGSISSRGTPDRPPLHAGGRLGEWIAGTYTAVAALAALRGGAGEHVDVSMFECMSITLGGFGSYVAAMSGTLDAAKTFPGPFRNVEVPSIVSTADGLVGFCTVTGQQFQDFLVLIERPELIGDERYALAAQRLHRQSEVNDMIEAWTTTRTTDEVIEQASTLRIPVAPIGRPDTITTVDHFVARGVYVRSPGGGFDQPRVPYLVEGAAPRPFAAAPILGADTGADWLPRQPRRASPQPAGRPLDGLRVIDLTAFWAGPAATQMLAALGADVIKVEGPRRPDGMRLSSTKQPTEDDWWEWCPIFHSVNSEKRAITLDIGKDAGRDLLLRLIAEADAVIENFSPRVLDRFDITWDVVSSVNPQAIMVRMPGFGLDGPWRDRTGFAQTMEQLSGMAWVSGYADGAPVIPRGPCDPLAGMHAVVAFLAAVHERDRSGHGHFVEVSMVEAALNCAAELVIEHSAYGEHLHRDGNRGPVAAPQGVYACRGTERWLALAVVDNAQWAALGRVLGGPDWMRAEHLADITGRRAHHDEVDAQLGAALAVQELDEIVAALLAAGVPAAPVIAPVAILDHPQARFRRFVEPLEHPITGVEELQGVPFRFGSRSGPWYERAAPTLGQHNHEVLADLLGLSAAEIGELEAAGVIADRLPS